MDEKQTTETNEVAESAHEKIRKIMEPYLPRVILPADGDYTKQVREWQLEKYLKGAGLKSLEDLQKLAKGIVEK